MAKPRNQKPSISVNYDYDGNYEVQILDVVGYATLIRDGDCIYTCFIKDNGDETSAMEVVCKVKRDKIQLYNVFTLTFKYNTFAEIANHTTTIFDAHKSILNPQPYIILSTSIDSIRNVQCKTLLELKQYLDKHYSNRFENLRYDEYFSIFIQVPFASITSHNSVVYNSVIELFIGSGYCKLGTSNFDYSDFLTYIFCTRYNTQAQNLDYERLRYRLFSESVVALNSHPILQNKSPLPIEKPEKEGLVSGTDYEAVFKVYLGNSIAQTNDSVQSEILNKYAEKFGSNGLNLISNAQEINLLQSFK